MGRERYLLQRDEAQSRRDIRESEERAARSRGGINTFRGIGRGLGMLAGLALAPATAGTSMLAMAGGLGSLGGSLAGGAAGKHKYGGPEKADVGLFNRDVAREQRKGVDQYWKGLKEQTAVNALQDAVTAGMYGTKIKDMMSQAKIQLGGTPKGMGVPTAPAPIQQVDTAGLVPDYQQQQLGQYLDQIKQSNIARADSFGKGIGTTTSGGAGAEVVDLISSPTDIAPNLTGTAAVGGKYGAGVTTDANILTGINAVPTSDTAISSVATNVNGMNPDVSLNLSGKSSLFSQPPASGSYTTDVLSSYGTGPNFLQDAVTNTGYTGSAAQNRQLIDYYNQTGPVQYNSVVDMLKAQGQGSSFDARTNLWNQLSQMGVR
tara:strand:- start:46 stop:1170 length:1125 start_codon:yes stop_codon:yes gene_type:complete